jgi:hydrogenase-4 component B
LFAVGLLALVGGITALVFVRLTGILLLGAPRSDAAKHAHESSPWMLGPMVVLLLVCFSVAVVPYMVIGMMDGVLTQIFGRQAGAIMPGLELAETPLDIIGSLNAWTLLAIAALAFVLLAWLRKGVCAEGLTWGCGYVRPTARMQYTGRSFVQMIADLMLPRFLRSRSTRQGPHGIFPIQSSFEAECPDPVTEKVYAPFFRRWADRFARLHILQHGSVNVYLVYVLLILVLALAWISVPRTWWSAL